MASGQFSQWPLEVLQQKKYSLGPLSFFPSLFPAWCHSVVHVTVSLLVLIGCIVTKWDEWAVILNSGGSGLSVHVVLVVEGNGSPLCSVQTRNYSVRRCSNLRISIRGQRASIKVQCSYPIKRKLNLSMQINKLFFFKSNLQALASVFWIQGWKFVLNFDPAS